MASRIQVTNIYTYINLNESFKLSHKEGLTWLKIRRKKIKVKKN